MARNKDRIRPFCERLAAAWERCPELRFGQLVSNAYASECERDPFYVDDEKSIEMIEAFTNHSPYYPPREDCDFCGKDSVDATAFAYAEKKKPKTNADCIRHSTDEELAVEMCAKGGCPHDCETPDDIDTDCVQCWLDWLKEEAKQ